MDIDPDIANWVLEFILRQPLEDRTLNVLLGVLPLPDDNPILQKSLLLKKLESDVSRRLVSETTLELLEQLEELEFRRGNEDVSDTMKRAYCAVAVECTLKLLKAGDDDGDDGRTFKFFKMVKTLWRERIGQMEKVVEKGGLGSDLLWAWKDEIEVAVWDDSVRNHVLKKFEGVQALEAVSDYLREEREKMGPSFLELVSERVKDDEGLQKILGVNEIDRVEETPSRAVDQVAGEETHARGVDRVAGEETHSYRGDQAGSGSNASDYPREEREKMGPSFLELVSERVKDDEGLRHNLGVNEIDRVEETSPRAVDQVAGEETHARCVDRVAGEETHSCRGDQAGSGSNASKEMYKGKIKLRDKLVGLRRPRGLASGSSRGAKIVDPDETRNYSLPRSAEVNKAREALALSSMELRAAVKDPLPDALRVAEVISSQAAQIKCQDPAATNDGRPTLFIVDVTGVVQSSYNANNVPGPSLMERKSSARSYEWEESMDESQDDIDCRAVHHLSSPKRINTSPLKLYEINNKNIKKRRKGRRWSMLEEDALRAGVEKYGKGNWKAILTVYEDMFEGRTEVDLKDKWRNMTRY